MWACKCTHTHTHTHTSKTYSCNPSWSGVFQISPTTFIYFVGGHTTEILKLVSSLSEAYTPRQYVVAETDKMSAEKIHMFEKCKADGGTGAKDSCVCTGFCIFVFKWSQKALWLAYKIAYTFISYLCKEIWELVLPKQHYYLCICVISC